MLQSMLEDVKTLEQQMVVRSYTSGPKVAIGSKRPSRHQPKVLFTYPFTQRSSEASDEERERLIIMAKEMDARADALPAEMDDYINASLPLVTYRSPICVR